MLSLLRLGLAIAFPFVAPGWRLAVVLGGGLSDFLDGFVARRFNAHTPSGQLIDAIADKLFVFSVIVTLTVAGLVTWWQMLLIISRDLTVAGVAAYVTVRRDWSKFRRLVPRPIGKLTTALQFTMFASLLLWSEASFTLVVLWVTILCSTVAAADYLWKLLTAFRADRAARAG